MKAAIQLPYGLKQETIDRINNIFDRYSNIEKVILYGSRAKGNYLPGSDIDLTLKGDGINLEEINKISNELDDLLLPYSFDLSIFNQISNPDLTGHIEREGKIFFKRSEKKTGLDFTCGYSATTNSSFLFRNGR